METRSSCQKWKKNGRINHNCSHKFNTLGSFFFRFSPERLLPLLPASLTTLLLPPVLSPSCFRVCCAFSADLWVWRINPASSNAFMMAGSSSAVSLRELERCFGGVWITLWMCMSCSASVLGVEFSFFGSMGSSEAGECCSEEKEF